MVDAALQAQLGLNGPRLEIPLVVLLHTGSPSKVVDGVPYSFNWHIIFVGDGTIRYFLNLITPTDHVHIVDYTYAESGELLRLEWLDGIVSNTCPTPIEFF
jgi:hypothetical protein